MENNKNVSTALTIFAFLMLAGIIGFSLYNSDTKYDFKFSLQPKTPKELLGSNEPMICYSPFDVYVSYDYLIADDNTTLITGHGRVYKLDDCRTYDEAHD